MKLLRISSILTFLVLMLSCASCGFEKETDDTSEITTISETERYIPTTQTARHGIDHNAEDEDFEGYTTTVDTEKRFLENPLPDEPDSDIIATTTTTYYTIPKTKKETQKEKTTVKTTKKGKTTTETKFVKDKLHKPLDVEKLKNKTKYKVVSDTTYLNLRFGPSKKYSVQLRIPDGVEIYGTARTKDDLNNYWIYVSYKGTFGWVMEELLKIIRLF